MDQQIGDAEYGIGLVLADDHIHHGAILLGNHTVDGQRTCHPLVLLDTAVVVGIQIGKIGVLIQRVLLHVDAGAVHMGAQDVHTVHQRLLADVEQGDGLLHIDGVDLIAGLQCLTGSDDVRQVAVALGLCHGYALGDALTLGLAVVQIFLVVFVYLHQSHFLLCVVFIPDVFVFHRVSSSLQ